MHPQHNKKTDTAEDVPEDLPFVSIIIPFEPQMKFKAGFYYIVNAAAAKSERELLKTYPEDMAKPVIEKMQRALINLNYTLHHGKSIGIFISPLVEKIYYFNYDTSLDNPDHRKDKQGLLPH